MATISLQGVKALVVDDPDTCDLLRFMLNAQGIATTCVTSVHAALQVYKSLRPNIVISGIALPGEDGFSLLRRIRALQPEDGGQVPVVAVTAYLSEKIRLEASEAGFQEFMPKPLDLDELLAVIAGLLKQQEGAKIKYPKILLTNKYMNK